MDDDDFISVPKHIVQGWVNDIVKSMLGLSRERRIEVIRQFCFHCGSGDHHSWDCCEKRIPSQYDKVII